MSIFIMIQFVKNYNNLNYHTMQFTWYFDKKKTLKRYKKIKGLEWEEKPPYMMRIQKFACFSPSSWTKERRVMAT